MAIMALAGCSAAKSGGDTETADTAVDTEVERPIFNADSAYGYVQRMVDFGPRVPNTDAHRKTGDWLEGKLKEFGWTVTPQYATLKAFDSTTLKARNIFAQINPDADDRLLLLAHWDCRPWADADPDESKRSQPVEGANDGASGVGVLLEIARQLGLNPTDKGIDILFVDAEDWGSHNDEDSWALGTRYFVENPPVAGYAPSQAILLDMVGSPQARFAHEQFSRRSNPSLIDKVWSAASLLGYGRYFTNSIGGAVTDDHLQLIAHGIPTIDIIDYREDTGFDPVWHTTYDNMQNISSHTLGAVGETLLYVIKN